MTGTKREGRVDPDSVINAFWNGRFEKLREQINALECSVVEFQFDISLAIMSFDKARLHYCQGIKYKNINIDRKNRLMFDGNSLSIDIETQIEKAKSGEISDTHSDTKEILTGDAVKVSISKRQKAYDLLSKVIFPEDAMFVPGKMNPEERDKNFKFNKDEKFRGDMVASYVLDAYVFPYRWIAAWPVYSYQPGAMLYIRANFADKDKASCNKFMKSVSGVIAGWETPIESELLALRVTLFQEALASAIGFTDIERAKKHIEDTSRFLIFNAGLEWIAPNDKQRRWTKKDREIKHFPPGKDIAKFRERWRVSCPSMSLPVLKLSEWHYASTLPHHAYLLDRAYDILLTESASLFNLVQGNRLQAASGLTGFFQDKAQSEVFLQGMREVIRVHEKLSLERPLGSENFGRLCQKLHETLDGPLHRLFDEATNKPFQLRPTSKSIADSLQSKEIIDLILAVRDDLRQGGVNGLSRYLLLKPLSPAWLSIVPPGLSALEEVNPFAITCCMVKAISRGMVWLPHLHLLTKPCPDYGNPDSEWGHIHKQWASLSIENFKQRIEITNPSHSAFKIIGFMKAFSDLCTALRVDQNAISVDGDKICISFETGADSDALPATFKCVIASNGSSGEKIHDKLGNFVSALSRLANHLGENNLTLIYKAYGYSIIEISGIRVSKMP